MDYSIVLYEEGGDYIDSSSYRFVLRLIVYFYYFMLYIILDNWCIFSFFFFFLVDVVDWYYVLGLFGVVWC